MPLANPRSNLDQIVVYATNAAAATSSGVRTTAVSPVRGKLVEAGFCPQAPVTSAMTLAVAVGNHTSSTASNFVQCITSTLGTFSSTNLFEGAVASVVTPSPAYVNAGGTIQWTTSGGDTAATGATFYAVIDRG